MIDRRSLLGMIGATVAVAGSGCMGDGGEDFSLDSYDIEGKNSDPLIITSIERSTYGIEIQCEIAESTATNLVTVDDTGVIEVDYLDLGEKEKSIYIDEDYILENSEFRVILLRKTENSPWTLGEDLNKGEVLAKRTVTLSITESSDE